MWFYVPAGDSLSPFEGNLPVFTSPTGALMTVFKVVVISTLAALLPVFYISAYTLVSPVLSKSQRRWGKFFVLTGALLFAAGASFVYYVLLPQGLRFLLNFGGNVAVALISVTDYMDMALGLMFWTGIVFQMPLVMFTVTKMHWIPYSRFNNKYFHRLVPIVLSVFAVIISPGTDLFTAAIVYVPLYGLWLLGLFASWLARPEEGNYLFLRSIWNALTWVMRRPKVAYSKVTWIVWRRWR